jgi:dipeptidyl aminopeptidase/acylaminoacyl peptidase
MTLEISWRWHRPATELYGPVFHPLAKDIAIVTKAHWPDFHDAESYPDSFFSSLEKRKESEPRFADPTIVLLEDRGKSERTIDWGWEPAFSPDGHLLAYAFQKRPLTGLRTLAKTMEGNSIRISRISDGATKGEDAVVPEFGYLSRPRFNPKGSMLAFSQNDAVNGAYGGKVGWGEVPVQFDKFPFIKPKLKEFDERYKQVQSFFQSPPDITADPKRFLAQSKRIREVLDDLPKEPSLTNKVPNGDHQTFLTAHDGMVVLEGKDGTQKGQLRVKGEIREFAWSPDSTRFAMIVSVTNDKLNDVFDYDELYIIDIKD